MTIIRWTTFSHVALCPARRSVTATAAVDERFTGAGRLPDRDYPMRPVVVAARQPRRPGGLPGRSCPRPGCRPGRRPSRDLWVARVLIAEVSDRATHDPRGRFPHWGPARPGQTSRPLGRNPSRDATGQQLPDPGPRRRNRRPSATVSAARRPSAGTVTSGGTRSGLPAVPPGGPQTLPRNLPGRKPRPTAAPYGPWACVSPGEPAAAQARARPAGPPPARRSPHLPQPCETRRNQRSSPKEDSA